MDEPESLSHTKWECKYHVIFIPKCRRRTLYAELRKHLGEVFRRLASQKGEVDPVSWTPEHLCSRSPRWRRRDHLTLLSSVARWSSWCVLAARQRNWQGSSNRPRSRSRTGSVRLSATPAAARAV